MALMRISIILLSIYINSIFSRDLNSSETHKDSSLPEKPQKLFKFNWENDLFFYLDREYTNGIKWEYGEFTITFLII